MGLSSFRYFVFHIIFKRAEKQMIWSNTWRIIAAMQNAQSIGDWAKVQFPRYAVRQNMAAFYAHPPVLMAQAASPDPASIGFLDIAPKAVNDAWAYTARVARFRAATMRAKFAFRFKGGKRLPTPITCDGWQSLRHSVFTHNATTRAVDVVGVFFGECEGFTTEQALACGRISLHINLQLMCHATAVSAARGFVMPNYTIARSIKL